MLKFPEDNRIEHPFTGKKTGKNQGAFRFSLNPKSHMYLLADITEHWERLSIQVKDNGEFVMPSIMALKFAKSKFWDEEDVVLHVLPKKSEDVSITEMTIHLWRPLSPEFRKFNPYEVFQEPEPEQQVSRIITNLN